MLVKLFIYLAAVLPAVLAAPRYKCYNPEPTTGVPTQTVTQTTIQTTIQTTAEITTQTATPYPSPEPQTPVYLNWTTVSGYFLQDETTTDPNGFDYISTNFGLIDRAYDSDAEFDPNGEKSQWQRFAHHIGELNKNSDASTEYKVLLMARHGEGWHNAAESYYGTPAWNCYWGQLSGNGTAVWEDPHLTPAGELEAIKANDFWRKQIDEHKQPAPESFYTSPLSRCTVTANLTFANLGFDNFYPIVKEFLREGVSIRTCDHRPSKTYITNMFPFYKFEEGFAELDPLYDGVKYETSEAQDLRNFNGLTDVFTKDKNTWISFTAHSGEITSLLRVLGHRAFRLATGQAIPVLVKVVSNLPKSTTTTIAPWTTPTVCPAPPVTSIANQGCVCTATATPTTTI
ncbi:hypothetical protein HK097_002335 [Rhizophlyctis rosea]|uniref:Phosphoglycerate mutase n=1 Tax=Rhizophlyctis rosea TaxID=64517 RepID=A0AAD5SMS4_9FUNG|nr:hypothetical protein HK097_002335 [Rhizophlyctis rosea]